MSNGKRLAATFGAAMASIYAAPELQADIVDLTFTPNSVVQGAGTVSMSVNPLSTFLLAVNLNDATTFYGYQGAIGGNPYFELGKVNYSQTLTVNTDLAYSFAPFIVLFNPLSTAPLQGGSTGTQFIGFRFNGNVGWFSINFQDSNVFRIVGGEYGTEGEAVHVGGTVPEPGAATALAALALGAIGVRRNRKSAVAKA